jgi:hypothetical protein
LLTSRRSGFPFALAPGYNYILAGLVLAIVPVMLFLLIWKTCFRRLLRKLGANTEENPAQQGAPPSYDAEPWRATENHLNSGAAGPPPAGLSIGLSELNKDGRREKRGRPQDLGPEQAPREYV